MPVRSPRPDITVKEENVLDWLFPKDSTQSDQPIWIDAADNNLSLSPKQLVSWVKRVGLGLQRLGLETGDSLMVFTPNHIFVPVAYLGAVCLGAAFSGASPAFTVAELVHQMNIAGPKILLVHPALLNTGLKAAEKSGIPKSQIYLLSDVPNKPTSGIQDWRSFMATEAETTNWQWPSFTPAQSRTLVGTINFSSGTTGLPKGVAVTHSNLIWNVEQILTMDTFDSNEKWLGFLPLYHAFGQLYAVLIATKANVPIYIMKTFVFEEYLRLIQTHKITRLQMVPPIMIMLAKRPEAAKYNLSSVKRIVCGAAPLSRELQRENEERFGIRISQGWGMSEMTCGMTGTPVECESPVGCVGLLLPNCELMLVDDEGKEVGRGERGEIYARGPQIALGYWRNKEATEETFGGGWLKTGDVGIVDEEGWLWIVDRKKELIKVNGLQVSPAELEMLLIKHPQIEDAAVVGINFASGELPRAYIKLAETDQGKLSPEEVQEWIKPRVSRHKQLSGGVVVVPEIPKLMSGKIQRKVLRQWAERDLKEIEKDLKAKL